MRCNNCGWENSSTNQKCEKCNSPLKNSLEHTDSPLHENQINQNLSATFVGASADLPFLDQAIIDNQYKNQAEIFNCPACGYPDLPEGTVKCPHCHTVIVANAARGIKKPLHSATINPYQQAQYASCVLTPVPREGEAKLEKIELSGDIIQVNRKNMDINNMTITSKVQAEIELKNGKCFITNKSEMKTTFIQVNEQIELKKGDVILMGDRKFIIEF